MNEYFVALLIISLIYRYFNFPNVISVILTTVKYVRLGVSLLMPPKKGSAEHLRGGLLKITYVDPNQFDGEQEVSVVLPYAMPAKKWDKVLQVTNASYQKLVELIEAEKKKEVHAATVIEQAVIEDTLLKQQAAVDDLAADMSTIAGETIDAASLSIPPSTLPVEAIVYETDPKAVKRQLKDCEKIDVTEETLKLAGPGKDFFGVPITAGELFHDTKGLIFLYGKKSQTFLADNLLNL